jgi:hypothetical protein
LPPVVAPEHCETCGRTVGPSIGKRFGQFLEAYAPGASYARDRDLLYRSRSTLAHGGALLTGELRHLAFLDFVPKSWGEREDGERALMIARLAGANWLLRRRQVP